MRKTIMAAALAATLLGGGVAIASQDAPRLDPLSHADANKDGVLTKDELLADVAARFASVDANKDGKITREEGMARFEGRRGGRMGKRMMERRGPPEGPGPGGPEGPPPEGPRGMRADTNGDGAVTLDEQRAQALKRFAYLDRNSDGKVDQAERDQMREMMMAMRGPGGPDGPGHHRGPPPPPPADAPDGSKSQ